MKEGERKQSAASSPQEFNENLQKNRQTRTPTSLLSLQLDACLLSMQLPTVPLSGRQTMSYTRHSERATLQVFSTARLLAPATCGSAGLCRAGCTDSELPLEKDSDREGTGGSSPLPVCLAWASGELWLVFLNLSSTCIRELEDMASC